MSAATSDVKRKTHTLGPYLIEYAETGVRWPTIYVRDDRYDDGIRQIAEISDHVAKNHGTSIKPRWRKSRDADEAEANARLFCAAPDLLAALNRLVSGGQKSLEAWDAARAAIAKAEGGASC